MKLASYTFLLFQLNRAMDAGNVVMTVAEVCEAVNERSVARLLIRKIKDIDLSAFSPDDWDALYDEWERLMDAADYEHKFSVRRNGICLLVAFVIEGIQRHFAS